MITTLKNWTLNIAFFVIGISLSIVVFNTEVSLDGLFAVDAQQNLSPRINLSSPLRDV